MYTHTHIFFLIKLVSFREKKNLCSQDAFLLEVKSYIYCVSHCVLLPKGFFLSIIFTAYGVDAAFSYKYNQQRGVCNKDGLGICPGFTTTHVVPV